MDEDAANEAPIKPRKGAGPSAAEESLTDALNGLEQILEHRRRSPHPSREPRKSGGSGGSGQSESGAKTPAPASTEAQYTIPLLHDVVVPGSDGQDERIAEHGQVSVTMSEADDDEAYRKLAERLANEIEVIVQARVEEAVQVASNDIREQVRNHLEIMLPEIIEELNTLVRR
jgi:hypothetical protein